MVLENLAAVTASPLQLIDGKHKTLAALEITILRGALSEALPVYMVPEVWIIVTATPLSISGKTDRKAIRQWVENLDDEMERQINALIAPNTREEPRTEEEKRLHAIICDVLNITPNETGINQSFMGLGGDSISAMRLVAKCRTAGFTISLKNILSRASISQLAAGFRNTQPHESITQLAVADNEEPFSLTPIQQHYVNVQLSSLTTDQDTEFSGPRRFLQSFFLRLTRFVDPLAVNKAVQQLTQRHPMLRARFSKSSKGLWQQEITKSSSLASTIQIHDAQTMEQAMSAISSASNSIDTRNGQVFQVVFFKNSLLNQGQLLFMTAHHLVIDLVSWRIILDELEQLLCSKPLPTPAGVSFQSWTALQASYSEQKLNPRVALPVDFNADQLPYWGITLPSANTYGITTTHNFTLDRAYTTLLTGQCHETLRTDVVDVLLASMVQSFCKFFSDRDVPTIFVEGHGREPWDEGIDLGSTVGWFTTLSPVSVPTNSQVDQLQTLRRTKDLRRQIPRNGWAYFASRYLNSDGRKAFQSDTMSEILFNFAGQFHQFENQGLFVDCDYELAGDASEVGPDTVRLALIEVSSVIKNGELQMAFILNKNMLHMDRLVQWINAIPATLETMLATLIDDQLSPVPTLSDFPLLHTTYENLDQTLADVCTRYGAGSWTDVEDVFPATPMQTAMLLRSAVSSEHYRTCAIFGICSPTQLEAEDVATAWLKVLNHNPALRTVFVAAHSADTAAFDQVVLKESEPQIRIIRHSNAVALQMLKSSGSSDWSNTTPHALTICQAGTEVLCKLEISHALMDGASMDIICNDLVAAIDGTLSDEASPSYSGYIKYLKQKDSADARAYWTKYLDGAEPSRIPAIKPVYEAGDTNEIPSVKIPIAESMGQLLATFAEQHGITPASVIQAAWAIVLRAYTQSNDISFGYAVVGRDIPVRDIDKIVGPFINVLPCRLDMTNGHMSAMDLASRVQQDFFAGSPFQHSSLAEIQHELKLGSRALFDTVVSIQRFSDASSLSSATGTKLDLLHSHDPNEVGFPNLSWLPITPSLSRLAPI